jgi:hypothetical protein
VVAFEEEGGDLLDCFRGNGIGVVGVGVGWWHCSWCHVSWLELLRFTSVVLLQTADRVLKARQIRSYDYSRVVRFYGDVRKLYALMKTSKHKPVNLFGRRCEQYQLLLHCLLLPPTSCVLLSSHNQQPLLACRPALWQMRGRRFGTSDDVLDEVHHSIG